MDVLEKLTALVNYCPNSGSLTWKERSADMFNSLGSAKSWNAKYAGKPAFNAEQSKGYKCGTFGGKRYFAHRVAFALYHGDWPDGQIDHINMNKADNRIENLRDVDARTNAYNSNAVGAYYNNTKRKWVAKIYIEGVQVELGRFDCFGVALKAYRDAKNEHHGIDRRIG